MEACGGEGHRQREKYSRDTTNGKRKPSTKKKKRTGKTHRQSLVVLEENSPEQRLSEHASRTPHVLRLLTTPVPITDFVLISKTPLNVPCSMTHVACKTRSKSRSVPEMKMRVKLTTPKPTRSALLFSSLLFSCLLFLYRQEIRPHTFPFLPYSSSLPFSSQLRSNLPGTCPQKLFFSAILLEMLSCQLCC